MYGLRADSTKEVQQKEEPYIFWFASHTEQKIKKFNSAQNTFASVFWLSKVYFSLIVDPKMIADIVWDENKRSKAGHTFFVWSGFLI